MDQTIYELAVLYRSELEESLSKASDKIKQMIKDLGGQILKEDVWGRRELAYAIKKQSQACYVFYDLMLDAQAVAKIEAQLNIDDDILRYQVYKPDLKALQAALAASESAAKAAAKTKPEKTEQKKEGVKANVA